jgi:hypothetical protein
MPRIRRKRIPKALMAHLVKRVRQREVSTSQLGVLARWLDSDPEVPEGRWFKRFPEMIVCGEGELVKTFLSVGQVPNGAEIK